PSTSTTKDGSGNVTFTAAANSGSSRSGTVTVAGIPVTISQRSVSCTYAINPPAHASPVEGDSSSTSVTTSAGCTWTATTNDSWITIGAGATGSGNGAVQFFVAANNGPARTGTI